MSSANVDGMLREGVNALKSGRRDEARALLLRAVELDQYNEEAWLWLSGVLDSLEDQRTALENVLSINPSNERASQGLDYINKQIGASPESAQSAPSAFAASSSGLSTSVEWGAPDDAPPGTGPTWNAPNPVPPPDVLDDWVSNLNLPNAQGAAGKSALGASPFGDVDLDDEDDLFASGPFKADATSAPVGLEEQLSPAERTARRRSRSEARRSTTSQRREESASPNAIDPIFGGIPAEVAATRLPGTVERAPALVTLLIVLLVIANIAAAVYFMVGFFG